MVGVDDVGHLHVVRLPRKLLPLVDFVGEVEEAADVSGIGAVDSHGHDPRVEGVMADQRLHDLVEGLALGSVAAVSTLERDPALGAGKFGNNVQNGCEGKLNVIIFS